MTNPHATTDLSAREWADQAITTYAGIVPQRLKSLPSGDKEQILDRWRSLFTTTYNELTGESSIAFREGAIFPTEAEPRPIPSEVTALGRRVDVLGRDALHRLESIVPIVSQPNLEEIAAAKRVIASAIEGLIAEFSTSAWPETVDLWIDQLIGIDDQETEGAIGRLGELTGLVEPWQTTTTTEDAALVQYLTVVGHVRCVASGWSSLRDRIGEVVSFSQVSAAVLYRAQCVATHVERLLTVMQLTEECLDLEVADEEDERLQLPLGDFLSATATHARSWQQAARRGRVEILAIQSFVDMFSVKYQLIYENSDFGSIQPQKKTQKAIKHGLDFAQVLEEELLTRVRNEIGRLAGELSELSTIIATLKDQPAAE
jgi:hypothetical protein